MDRSNISGEKTSEPRPHDINTPTYRWVDLKAVDGEPIAPNPVAPDGLATRRVHVLARVLVHPHPGNLKSHPRHPEHILRRIPIHRRIVANFIVFTF